MRNNLLISQFCVYDEFKQFGLMTDKINSHHSTDYGQLLFWQKQMPVFKTAI